MLQHSVINVYKMWYVPIQSQTEEKLIFLFEFVNRRESLHLSSNVIHMYITWHCWHHINNSRFPLWAKFVRSDNNKLIRQYVCMYVHTISKYIISRQSSLIYNEASITKLSLKKLWDWVYWTKLKIKIQDTLWRLYLGYNKFFFFAHWLIINFKCIEC